MAGFHNRTENWTSCECSIMENDIDIEEEIDYTCILKTSNEPDVVDQTIPSLNSTEDSFSDNIPSQVNERAHINIIEMYEQVSNKYQAFFTYEDLFSTYVVLKPLKEVPNSANFVPEVAKKLINIFSVIGAPQIIESSNGRSFAEKIVRELRQKIQALKIVHGNIIRQNNKHRDFKTLMHSWHNANSSKLWHEGLHFIQLTENTSIFSISRSETSLNSPAEIFFRANLANDLVRFITDKNSVEDVNNIWTEEELLKKIESHESSIPSLTSLNEFVDCNYKKENVDSFDSINSIKNEDLFETKENCIDAINETGYECWTEEDWPIKTESHQSPILSRTSLHEYIDGNNEEQNVDSFNLINSINEALSGTEQDFIDTNNCDVENDDNEIENGSDAENGVSNVRIYPKRRSSRISILSKKKTLDLSKIKNFVKSNKNEFTTTQNSLTGYESDSSKKVFTAKSELKQHILTHTEQKLYQCDFCGNKSPSAYELNQHMSPDHQSKKIYKCKTCTKTLETSSGLTKPKLVHSGKRSFQCHLCTKRFNRQLILDSHLAVHSDLRPFECDVCKRTFKLKEYLRHHMIRVHREIKPFKCEICDATFSRNQTLKVHVVSIHENRRPLTCDICKVTFKHKQALQDHAFVHGDIRPFKCHMCNSTFRRKQTLQDHIGSVHGDIRPFKCHMCKQTFKLKRYLQNHITSIHRYIRPLKCDICMNRFANKRSLQSHNDRFHMTYCFHMP